MTRVDRRLVSVLLSFVILSGATFLACRSSNAVVGTYTSETDRQNVIELKPDGSFVARDGEKTVAGKYEVRNAQITFRTDSGFASQGTLAAGSIDRDGELFTRQ